MEPVLRKDFLGKFILLSVLLLFLFFEGKTLVLAADTPAKTPSVISGLKSGGTPTEVLEAATKGLPRYLEAAKEDKFHAREWGLFNQEGIAIGKIILGEPWEVYFIDEKKFFKYDGKESILTMVYPARRWEFPVFSSGQPRATLQVDFINGLWQAVGLGSGYRDGRTQIADSIKKKWSSAKDLRFIIVNVPYAFVSFFVVSREGEVKIVPLGSGDFGSHHGQECDLVDIYPTLKHLLEERKGGGLLR